MPKEIEKVVSVTMAALGLVFFAIVVSVSIGKRSTEWIDLHNMRCEDATLAGDLLYCIRTDGTFTIIEDGQAHRLQGEFVAAGHIRQDTIFVSAKDHTGDCVVYIIEGGEQKRLKKNFLPWSVQTYDGDTIEYMVQKAGILAVITLDLNSGQETVKSVSDEGVNVALECM